MRQQREDLENTKRRQDTKCRDYQSPDYEKRKPPKILLKMSIELSAKILLFMDMLLIDTLRCFPFFFFLSGPHPWRMEVPRLGVQSELQLPALLHSHSQARSKPCLLMATLDP